MDNLIGWLGVILIANACWMTFTRLSARGRATGRVVGHEARQLSPSDSTSPATTLYHPVIEFADRDAAIAWYHGEQYQQARELRGGAADFRMYVVDGI